MIMEFTDTMEDEEEEDDDVWESASVSSMDQSAPRLEQDHPGEMPLQLSEGAAQAHQQTVSRARISSAGKKRVRAPGASQAARQVHIQHLSKAGTLSHNINETLFSND